ncbi:hypothetical protein M885DRAFT_622413 [Pelagophyceae sp. CCMP2097]|nr:hypothetical protein M885DRAFT_622413 [Pelagophyceae sp. CCMP2097]|mmetsp:Transcript_1335/g.4955  ORF Transcript_1335/g.4955 Transcript_1335/m.4955 type:complete len:341 (+) Transcript_1335:236-1258(+)
MMAGVLEGVDGFEGAELTLDSLTPEWRVFQLKRGHRFSNDDKLASWRAADHAPHARRLLDLGSGIGSVGLGTLWRMNSPGATLQLVEAQAVSCALVRKSISANGLGSRVSLIEADLRGVSGLDEGAFDIVTGSPPYFAPDAAVASEHSQKAHCRLELRGGLEEYCAAAARFVSPRGRFVFVMTAADARCEAAPPKHGLVIVERFDYVFKQGRLPQITTIVCARQSDPTAAETCVPLAGAPHDEGATKVLDRPRVDRVITLRDAQGRRTVAYRAIQEYLQLRPQTCTLDSLDAALAELRAAAVDGDAARLRQAVEAAEHLGMKPTKGSDELNTALVLLKPP